MSMILAARPVADTATMWTPSLEPSTDEFRIIEVIAAAATGSPIVSMLANADTSNVRVTPHRLARRATRTESLAPHVGQWVVVKDGHVLFSGARAVDVVNSLRAAGLTADEIFRVPVDPRADWSDDL